MHTVLAGRGKKRTYILLQPSSQSLPPILLDQILEGRPQPFRVKHRVEHKRHGHVVALDQRAVLEEMQRKHPVSWDGLCRGLTPEEEIHFRRNRSVFVGENAEYFTVLLPLQF